MKRACKECKALTEKDRCPVCGSTSLSESWEGRVLVLNEAESEIGRKLKLKKGEFAIKVR